MHGETEQRLFAVAVWRKAPSFSERERAALAWTEGVTLVSHDQVPHDIYEIARREFSEKELIDLTVAVIAINGIDWPSVFAHRLERISRLPRTARPGRDKNARVETGL